MCGILGQVSERQEDLDSWAADDAIRALRHRGPDGEGSFEDRAQSPACRLVHTRLAIIDTSAGGQQPMFSPDGRHVLVFNGEIYNYLELRSELEREGERFRTQSDSEVLLRACVLWGGRCLPKLRGMFAFAVWDRKERRLTLGRDRLGIKPLYIFRKQGLLAFSSEVRALLRVGIAPARMSRTGLEAFLAFGSVWGSQTLLENVVELEPGAIGTFQSGVFDQKAFWKPPRTSGSGGPRNLNEAVESVRPVLREAVKLQLRSDVKLGVFLSAGLDSSSLAALVKQENGSPPVTLTVTFDGSHAEGESAKATAEYLGSEHHETVVSLDQARKWVPEAVASMDQPSVDGVNTWIVARSARGVGLRVALSGLGSDEIFAGYGSFHLFPRLLKIPPALRPLGYLATRLMSLAPFEGVPNRMRKAAWLVRASGDARGSYAILRALFVPEQAACLLPGHPGLSPFVGASEDPSDPIRCLSELELRHYLRFTLLRDTDSMSMAHGLEVRPPFLDEVLCERVLALSGPIKLGRAENKPVLLGATRELLPPGLGGRPKSGFELPFDAWLNGPLREWHTEGLAASVALAGIDSKGSDALVRARKQRPSAVQWHRWFALASLGHWAREHHVSLA